MSTPSVPVKDELAAAPAQSDPPAAGVQEQGGKADEITVEITGPHPLILTLLLFYFIFRQTSKPAAYPPKWASLAGCSM